MQLSSRLTDLSKTVDLLNALGRGVEAARVELEPHTPLSRDYRHYVLLYHRGLLSLAELFAELDLINQYYYEGR